MIEAPRTAKIVAQDQSPEIHHVSLDKAICYNCFQLEIASGSDARRFCCENAFVTDPPIAVASFMQGDNVILDGCGMET
jgi:hypothetical protein